VKRVVAALAALLVVGGCTGVPSTSAPQTVEPLDTGSPSRVQTVGPELNADARTIVSDFLTANAHDSDQHASARSFLTSAARSRWSDAAATIVSDLSVDIYNEAKHTLTVYGRVLGTLNAEGIYTPLLQAEGQGGERQPFQFTLTRVDGQFRIDQLHNGLLLTQQQFQTTFQQHVLYFYDVAEQYLVPDLRWNALDDRTQIATWLLTQLISGPRPELQNTVSTDTLPAQADPRHVTVKLGNPTEIEIPGSSQLDAGVRDRLAAQVSQTLLDTVSGRAIALTDGGTPVEIPRVHSDQFTASEFTFATGPSAPDPAVYYLANGQIRTEDGRALPGPLGNGSQFLNSIALSRSRASGALLVAGVAGSGASGRLMIGTQAGGVRETSVHGQLTRPSFAPGRGEVWIGQGPRIYRVTTDGTQSRVSRVPIPAVSGGGRIVAVRVSPEGSRIAIIVSGASAASAQLYVGSIMRGPGQVRVDTLDPISPEGVVVQDVAWLDSLKLFAIGYLSSSRDPRTFETGVDGTEWTNLSIGNLPSPPDSVTVATAATVWVSANGFVWKQNGAQWVSPGPNGQTPGRVPVYLD
jgi:hypothetical protein